MCGIIGYVGRRPCKDLLLAGLERLEYRGYDSAGIALLADGNLEYTRAVGPLAKLKDPEAGYDGPFLLEQLTPAPPRPESRPPAPEGLLLVGGVRYDDQPDAGTVAAQRASATVVGEPLRWDYLRGSAQERALLEKLLAKAGPKVTALGGRQASAERLRQELEKARELEKQLAKQREAEAHRAAATMVDGLIAKAQRPAGLPPLIIAADSIVVRYWMSISPTLPWFSDLHRSM